jgi:hypothetical protein
MMKKIYYLLRYAFASSCSIALIFLATQSALAVSKPYGQSWQLKNKFVTVSFSKAGLKMLYDHAIDKKFNFSKDSFSITINGKKINRQKLHFSSTHKQKNKLIYTYSNQDYDFTLIYKLEPSWHFISKRLKIKAKTGGSFTINKVSVLQEKLNDSVASDYIPKSLHLNLGPKDYGIFLRFADHKGMFAFVQNPFLAATRHGSSFNISYKPDMKWNPDYGPFASDRACLGTYALTGQKIPVNMVPEWKWTHGVIKNEGKTEDVAEIQAFTNCVSKFITDHQQKPINVNVGWTENDYQIDVSTASGREAYKRIIDQAAAIGIKYIVYAPTNSKLAKFTQAVDDWHWEEVLWLGLGIKIRKNQWDPHTDSLPSSVRKMLNYAKSKGVKLLAYVYPVMPFQQNKKWLVTVNEGGHQKQYANLGNRTFQNWLIDELTAFKKKTGIGGFSFDYTFLNYPGKSVYAQWKGWQRVMRTLRKRFPNIVIDGRQAYQYYGPWSWLAGSYPHPTSTDEQPESFTPFPDLHTDRVSADRARYANYRYRIRDYCPAYLMPGFITHQTERYNLKGELVRESFRRRDWDYMGWKYSLISSIGIAGLNNVINMIPARDPQEFRNFSNEGKDFFHKWLGWTKAHRNYLKHARPILGQPAIGKVDGASDIIGNEGYVFLYNPNGRAMPADFSIDQSIGLKRGSSHSFILKELYPVGDKKIGKSGAGIWHYGDRVHIPIDGARAMVLKIEPVVHQPEEPQLFNIAGKVTLQGTTIRIDSVRGEMGTIEQALVKLPDAKKIKEVYVNDTNIPFSQHGSIITVPLHFKGAVFHHMQQIGSYDPNFKGDSYSASFTIPQRIFDQLETRKKKWPIAWTQWNYDTPWLAPARLLLFVQIAQPSDTMNVQMEIDGKSVHLKKAYSSVRPHSPDFVGFYADLSSLKAGKEYHVTLHLPTLKPGQFQGLFFENVKTEYTGQVISGKKNP